MSASNSPITAEELFEGATDGPADLVRGELVPRQPKGFLAGLVVSRVAMSLCSHVRQLGVGEVLVGRTGFILEREPDTVRAASIAFLDPRSRASQSRDFFVEGPPTLVVEVVSFNDQPSDVMAKVSQWLNAGCQRVWLIDPQREKATICRLVDGQLQATDTDEIVEPELLPGFTLDTATLWQR